MVDNGELEQKLFEIERDLTSGAAQLAHLGVELLTGACENYSGAGRDEAVVKLKRLASRLGLARPSMAPIVNWSVEFIRRFEELSEQAPDKDFGELGRSVAAALEKEKEECLAGIVEAAKTRFANTGHVFTLSYSSTVENILTHAARSGVTVTVAESRPGFEGRKTCQRLLDAGKKVRLITDAQMGLAVKETEVVLIGADTILSDFAVINKTGSYLAALAARDAGVPFIVAADTYKVDPAATADSAPLEKKNGDEVWSQRPEICSNIYFEPVPARLITGYLTEKGLIDAASLAPEVDRWKGARTILTAD